MTSKRTEEEIREQLADHVLKTRPNDLVDGTTGLRDKDYGDETNYPHRSNMAGCFVFDDFMEPLFKAAYQRLDNALALGEGVTDQDHRLLCDTLNAYSLGRISYHLSRINFSEANSAEMINRVVSALYNIGEGVDNL